MGEVMLEKWSGAVNEVVIGATKSEGGTRTSSISVGGQKGLPYLFAEGFLPHKAKIAFEVWDSAPSDWPDALTGVYGKLLHDPLLWAQECVHKYKAELLCVRMQAAHPDCGDTTPEESADFIRKLLKKVGVPLIILGCGDDAKDNLVLPACCEAARGERCLVGDAMQDNYKTLAAAVMDGRLCSFYWRRTAAGGLHSICVQSAQYSFGHRPLSLPAQGLGGSSARFGDGRHGRYF